MATVKKKSIILRILLLIFAVYMIYTLGHLSAEYNSKRKDYASYVEKAEKLKFEIDEYNYLLEQGNEKEITEKVARSRLGFCYPGEVIFRDDSGN